MDALKTSAVVLVVSSPKSVSSPWVNFESGGGWLAGAQVIPCCVAGMVPSSLPMPLQELTALDLTTSSGVEDLFRAIAEAAELNAPHDLPSNDIAQRISEASSGPSPDATTEFVDWVRHSSLRPEALKDTTGTGEATVGGHIGTADAIAVRSFGSRVQKGDSVSCWVEVPGYGTLYHCYASGDRADQLTDLANDRYQAARQRARVTLRCLGALKVFAADVTWGDEDQGVSYEPAYLIEALELINPRPLPSDSDGGGHALAGRHSRQ